MLRLLLSALLGVLAAGFAGPLRADTSVVFNEIMYHPATNETTLEWVELRNQMAVDVDLSGWSLDGGIHFTFASNTIVRGGRFVLVALSPAMMAAVTGSASNVFGPFTGTNRLGNGGDTLRLRNNSGRVVDAVNYGTDGDWPVAPDGSGVSLAKRDRDSASGPAANWTWSEQMGGTPGAENFAVPGAVLPDIRLCAIDATWKYEASGVDLGAAWRAAGFDDSAWASRASLTNRSVPGLFNTGVGANGVVLANGVSDPHYILTAAAQGTVGANALAILNHPAWLANDAASSFIGVINPGVTSITGGNYYFQTTFSLAGFLPTSVRLNLNVAVDNVLTDVFINGSGSGLSTSGFAAFNPTLVLASGFVDGVNTLEFRTVNQGDGPGGFRATLSGTGLAANSNPPLPAGLTTYYFRKSFAFSGDPAYTQLRLNPVIADGALIYLNGVEVFRQNMPAGPAAYATEALSDVPAPGYSGLAQIPAASLLAGNNVLAVEVHQAAGSADGPLFGAELIATPLPVPATALRTLAFNEFSPSTNAEFWLELVNYGTNSLPLDGCVIVRDGVTNSEYVFPAGPALGQGGYVAITNTTLGFQPVSGDKLYLLAPARNQVLDAVVVKKAPRGRSPDGTGPYLFPSAPTPGGPNGFAFHNEIVINEIMYNHRDVPGTNGLPSAKSKESWVELYNKSASPVDLNGWELDGGITYRFFNKTLAPGAYLVVARDAAYLRSLYPGLDIAGDFSKALAGSGDTILLRDPSGNPADQVRYFNSGRWPAFAGAGGSSLELRDPNADNSKAEAWAASDEAGKTSWQTYSYRMVAASSATAGPDGQWREFVLGLLSDGECWIDDLSVVQSPTNSPIQFIANGNFESGLGGWRAVGNHVHSRVETDPDDAGNHVLHLVATGPQEHMHNHIETTFTNGRSVTNGRLYEISFRARHIAGNNLLNTRLYFNRVAQTTALPTAELNGTPGARNSRYATNIGPTFAQFQHQRVVPQAGEAVTVSVMAQDPQGVSTCEVWWSANSGAWLNAGMPAQGGGIYSGTIPGFPAGTVVQFYVRAVDGLGAASTFPAAGPDSGALYKVNDGTANLALTHNVRIILTPANTALLHASTNVMSNDLLPCTVIYDESRAYYDAAVHLKSSERGRDDPARVGFHLVFQPDDLFRGVHPVMLIDRSNSGRPAGEEILLRHMALRAGVPMTHADLCRVLAPQSAQTGQGIFSPRYEDEFMETAFENGLDGTLFEMELIYYPTTANAAGYKNPQPDGVQGVDFSDLGNDKETYRYNFILKNHRDVDDFSRLIAFSKSWSATGAALEPQTRLTTDWDAWMRSYALVDLMGVGDMYSFGNNHNLMAYVRPSDQRMLYFLWDMDFSFNRGTTTPFIGNQNIGRIVNAVPSIRRCFYAHLLDHVNTVFNTGYMTYWFNRYDDFTLGQDFVSGGGLSFIQQRGDFARTSIGNIGGNAAFAVTGASSIVTSNNLITLSGTAPVQVKTIRLNGVEYPVVWTSISGWTLRVPVTEATNVLSLVGYDVHGKPLTNFTRTITVNYTGPTPSPEGAIVFSEIFYDPSAPDSTFVEIHNASYTAAFDIGGWKINGLGFTFPYGTVLVPRDYIVVVKSMSAFASQFGFGIAPIGQFDGNVDPDGETLSLIKPATTNSPEVLIDRVRYEAQSPWPSTLPGNSLQLIDDTQDNGRVSNWTVSPPGGLPPLPIPWVKVTRTGNIQSATNLLIWLGTAASSCYVDDISLVDTNGNDIVINGGFETGDIAPWDPGTNYASSVIVSGVSHSGSRSLLLKGVVPGVQLPTLMSQNIAGRIVTNANYTLTAWILLSTNPVSFSARTLPGNNLSTNGTTVPAPPRSPSPSASPGQSNYFTGTLPPYDPLWLNELQSENAGTLRDNYNEADPWIEIYNAGPAPIDLSGYYLADSYASNDLTGWQFPAAAHIAPGEFKILWADGQPGQTSGTNLHTSFRLPVGNGTVALSRLVNGQPQLTDYLTYTNLRSGLSYGDFPDGQPYSRRVFQSPTGGGTNSSRDINVFINEWMAANASFLIDPSDGQYDDWFELYNAGDAAVDLGNYYLTDNLDQPTKYHIPNNGHYVIPAGGHLLVWADNDSGDNSTNVADLHVNFALTADPGEAIGLYGPDGVTAIDTVTFGPQTNNISEGRYADGATARYFMTTPTPRAANMIPNGNTPPVLNPIANRTIRLGQTVSFTATATDAEAGQTLTFALTGRVPSGAMMNAAGQFNWTPHPVKTPSTNTFTVVVTDNGPGALSDTKRFNVTVLPVPVTMITGNGGTSVTVSFDTIPGRSYRLYYKADIDEAAWLPLSAPVIATGFSLTLPDNIGANRQRFYRVVQVN